MRGRRCAAQVAHLFRDGPLVLLCQKARHRTDVYENVYEYANLRAPARRLAGADGVRRAPPGVDCRRPIFMRGGGSRPL